MVKAPWRGQDVLAGAWSIDLHDFECGLSVQAYNKECEDNCGCVLCKYIQLRILTNGIDQIKRHARESLKHAYTVFFVPRVSTLVTRILEEEGVLGDVVVSTYNLQFIPLADDVVSLERDNTFKELWVVCMF